MTTSAVQLTNYTFGKWQDLAFGAVAYTPPATYYAQRCLTMPSLAGVGGSFSAGAAVAITNNATNYPASSAQSKQNGTSIIWAALLAQETHAGWLIRDDPTAGNIVAIVTFATPIVVPAGDIPFVAAGDLKITIQNNLTTPANGGVFPSNFLIASLLDHTFGATAYSPAANHFLRRFTASPTAVDGSGTEASYTAYAAKSFANNTTSYANSSANTKKNAIDIVPTAAGSGPTTITDWVIADAASGGHYLLICHSANALSLLSGGTDDVPANAINWNLAAA